MTQLDSKHLVKCDSLYIFPKRDCIYFILVLAYCR